MPKGDNDPELRHARKAEKLARRHARSEKCRASRRAHLQRPGTWFGRLLKLPPLTKGGRGDLPR